MYGTLYFRTLAEVAEFLHEHMKSGSTAVFEVDYDSNGKGYAVRFNGAY
jgi:hypothetical protein